MLTGHSAVLRQQYLPQHPHFESTLRLLIATSIASCFSRVPVARLSNWVDLPAADVPAHCESIGWKVEGDMAVVPKNGDNDVKAGVVKENVELSRELKLASRDIRLTLVELTKLVSAAAF